MLGVWSLGPWSGIPGPWSLVPEKTDLANSFRLRIGWPKKREYVQLWYRLSFGWGVHETTYVLATCRPTSPSVGFLQVAGPDPRDPFSVMIVLVDDNFVDDDDDDDDDVVVFLFS